MTTSAWQGIGVVVAAFILLTVVVRHCKRRRAIGDELARKAIHIGTGLVALSFPVLFASPEPVVLLAFCFTIGLGLSRLIPQLSPLFGDIGKAPGRKSFGEIVFPAGVGLLFVLSDGRPFLYIIPVLILTWADAGAALIGARYGKVRYLFWEEEKSLEGSAVFLVVAFFCTYMPLLLLTESGPLSGALISVTVALLVMLLEALAWRGLDNLSIPLGAFLLLHVLAAANVTGLVALFAAAVFLASGFTYYCCARGAPSPRRPATAA